MKSVLSVPAEILSRQDLPLYIKIVYGRIAYLLSKNDRVIMTTDEIAMQCGITRRNAAKALPELAKLGLVKPHESLDGHGLRRILERQEPTEAAIVPPNPEMPYQPRNNDLPKKSGEK